MIVKVWCSIGTMDDQEETVDLEKWNITDDEWSSFTEDDKYDIVSDWASNYFTYGFSEVE